MAGGTTQLIGIIGASSFVGHSILRELTSQHRSAIAFSRKPSGFTNSEFITWSSLAQGNEILAPIHHWILIAPIWAMPDYFDLMNKRGARSVVALSSTSVITKENSSDIVEQTTIKRMLAAEKTFREWAETSGINWAILRPTLIYGHGQDKNLSEIARIIARTRIFPILGGAKGLRQPVHVDDVAFACLAALNRHTASAHTYTLSGGEVLCYREMVRRVFLAMNLRPLLLNMPAWAFRLAVSAIKKLPRYQSWTTAMADRMNMDMVFSHEDARRDFGYNPRSFQLTRQDLP